MSRLCRVLSVCLIVVAFLLTGCTSGLYTSRATLDAHRTQKAVSYDGVVEYIETEEPTVVLKVIEYRSKGSESPQVSLTFTYICSVGTDPKGEECYPLNGNDGNPLTYAATGPGLLNESIALGQAAVTAGGIAGAARLLRPATYNESTHVEGVSQSKAEGGEAASQSRSEAYSEGSTSLNTNLNNNVNQNRNRPQAHATGGAATSHADAHSMSRTKNTSTQTQRLTVPSVKPQNPCPPKRR